MAIPKDLRNKRFHEAINRLKNDRKLTTEDICNLASRERTTIYRWLNGTMSPSKKELIRLCELFGWDYEAYFIRDVTIDAIYDASITSVEILHARYQHLIGRNPIQARTMLPLIAGLVQSEFFYNNIEAMSICNTKLEPRIQFTSNLLAGFSLTFPADSKCVKMRLELNNVAVLDSRVYSVTNTQVKEVVKFIADNFYGRTANKSS